MQDDPVTAARLACSALNQQEKGGARGVDESRTVAMGAAGRTAGQSAAGIETAIGAGVIASMAREACSHSWHT